MKISGGWSPDGARVDFEVEVELRPQEERDFLAAFALAGLLANGVPTVGNDLGEVAYRAADTLLAERRKK